MGTAVLENLRGRLGEIFNLRGEGPPQYLSVNDPIVLTYQVNDVIASDPQSSASNTASQFLRESGTFEQLIEIQGSATFSNGTGGNIPPGKFLHNAGTVPVEKTRVVGSTSVVVNNGGITGIGTKLGLDESSLYHISYYCSYLISNTNAHPTDLSFGVFDSTTNQGAQTDDVLLTNFTPFSSQSYVSSQITRSGTFSGFALMVPRAPGAHCFGIACFGRVGMQYANGTRIGVTVRRLFKQKPEFPLDQF